MTNLHHSTHTRAVVDDEEKQEEGKLPNRIVSEMKIPGVGSDYFVA